MGPPTTKRTSPRNAKPSNAKNTTPVKVFRVCWSQKNTSKLLEALVVLHFKGFDPNDTN